jgi:hypothetical protein
MEDFGGRLSKLMLDCFALKQDFEASAGEAADSGNIAERLIARLPANGQAIEVFPYVDVIPNLQFGFDPGAGARVALRRSPAGQSGLLAMLPALQLEVLDIGSSGWLTIEYRWDWEVLLAKRSAHVLFEGEALPATAVRPKLRMRTLAGAQHDIEAGQFRLGKQSDLRMASFILPAQEIEIDYSSRPTIILFLDPANLVVSLTRLFVW